MPQAPSYIQARTCSDGDGLCWPIPPEAGFYVLSAPGGHRCALYKKNKPTLVQHGIGQQYDGRATHVPKLLENAQLEFVAEVGPTGGFFSEHAAVDAALLPLRAADA